MSQSLSNERGIARDKPDAREPSHEPVDSSEDEHATRDPRKRRKKTKASSDSKSKAKHKEPLDGSNRIDWSKYPTQYTYLRKLVPLYLGMDTKLRKAEREKASKHIASNWPAGLTSGDWDHVSLLTCSCASISRCI